MTITNQHNDAWQTCCRCGWTSDDAGTLAADELCHVCITAPPRPTNVSEGGATMPGMSTAAAL